MRTKLVMTIAVVLLGIVTTARADNFVADFSCTGSCDGAPKTVPMHFDKTDGDYHGTAHWDTLAWNFYLPANWATGTFSWGAFVDTTASGINFLTFRIEDNLCCGYDVELSRLCPTEKACQHESSFGDVVFRDRPNTEVPETGSTAMLLILGGAFVIAFGPRRRQKRT